MRVGSAVWGGRRGGEACGVWGWGGAECAAAATRFDFAGRTGGARVASWITPVTRDGHFILIYLVLLFPLHLFMGCAK